MKRARVKGSRPRPRVALAGGFADSVIDRFRQLFPTIWASGNFDELRKEVDGREVDLVIVGPGVMLYALGDAEDFLRNAHLISFSTKKGNLPGPFSGTSITIRGQATSDEYVLPELPLALHRRREIDLQPVTSVKAWTQAHLIFMQKGEFDPGKQAELRRRFRDRAIVLDHHDGVPLAALYWRGSIDLAVAWLPNPAFSQSEWVEVLCHEWATADQERSPCFGDWTKSPEWMVPEEADLANRIRSLEEQKIETVKRIDGEIGQLSQDLAQATLATNQGRRRLLTAQDDELVAEVLSAFSDLGFEVEDVDKALKAKSPKREDLRLRPPDNQNWVAIVEVRGYAKSAGKTSDLLRLRRFADLFRKETGRLPDKLIYVVNGQTEMHNPSLRQQPLESAEEDVEVFAEDEGVVIWSGDLFKLGQVADQASKARVRESIISAQGRWKPPPPAL